jgi:hypothetical protein
MEPAWSTFNFGAGLGDAAEGWDRFGPESQSRDARLTPAGAQD